MTLDQVVTIWEGEEHTLEEKLDHLEKHIFEHLGLKEEPSYYLKKGSFFERYLAGFINTYFLLVKDISFIILDPIHIFDIITSFAKGVITHPIKTMKTIWGCWTFNYKSGAYALGGITANALLIAVTAGAAAAAMEGEALIAVEASASAFSEKVVGNAVSLPKKLIGIVEKAKTAITSHEEVLQAIMREPQAVIADAATSLKSGVSFGKVRTFKFYSGDFLKHRKFA